MIGKTNGETKNKDKRATNCKNKLKKNVNQNLLQFLTFIFESSGYIILGSIAIIKKEIFKIVKTTKYFPANSASKICFITRLS